MAIEKYLRRQEVIKRLQQPTKEQLPVVVEYATFRHAKNNPDQDADLDFPERNLFAVADGVGGRKRGDLAAKSACASLQKAWEDAKPDTEMSVDGVVERMEQSVLGAHQTILSEAAGDDEKKGMSTTLTAVKLWQGPNGERKAIFAWVGDAQGAIQRADGTLEQITRDDDLIRHSINDQKRVIELQRKMRNATRWDELSDKLIPLDTPLRIPIDGKVSIFTRFSERHFFAYRSIVSQCLGGQMDIMVNIVVAEIQPGDRIVLATDGETDSNTHDTREEILRTTPGTEQAANALGNKALETSEKPKTEENIRSKRDDMRVKVIVVA
jgi:serine/threonine protein phosphatase PrpC